MASYQRGETVVLTLSIVDEDGAAQSPATSMTVTVTDPGGTAVVDAQSMTEDSTGNYHYDYTVAADATIGEYAVTYTAVDGARTSIEEHAFTVEPALVAGDDDWCVSLTEAKNHLKVDYETDDDLIRTLLSAATNYCENATGKRFMDTTETKYMDHLGEVELDWGPLDSITSVTYYDTADVQKTLSTDVYTADTVNGRGWLRLTYDETWPTDRGDRDNVCITYVAGYGDAADCPAQAKAAIKLLVGHLYEHRESVTDGQVYEVPMTVKALLATIAEPRAH